MSKRDEILREILKDPDIMEKYGFKKSYIDELTAVPPHHYKIIDVLATIINENDNGRTARQIYPIIKSSIHKI